MRNPFIPTQLRQDVTATPATQTLPTAPGEAWSQIIAPMASIGSWSEAS